MARPVSQAGARADGACFKAVPRGRRPGCPSTRRSDARRPSRRGGRPMTQLDLTTPWGVTLALLPEVILSGWALVVLLVVSWRHQGAEDSRLAGWLSFAGVVLSGAAVAALWVNG